MAANNTLNGLHEKLGELTGKIGEMNHNLNNQTMKVEGVAKDVTTVLALIRRVDDLEERDRDKSSRLAVLEADKNRREGAVGLVTWFARHWPFTIVMAFITALIIWASGKPHP